MGSWIRCHCGELLHKNHFAGAGVHVVVSDVLLNDISDDETAAKIVERLVLSCDILVRCRNCGRLAIEDARTGAIRIYSEDKG